MSCEEHLIENAIFAWSNGVSFEEWKKRERMSNADLSNAFSYHATNKELELIWKCGYYVMYTLFDGPEDFKERHNND